MVRQVFMQEKVAVGNSTRIRTGLAFGDHPDIDPEEDDREVTAAVARGQQRMRIVLDELVSGNAIEEIGCADGSFSVIPDGADPDDIARCSGPQEAIVESCQGDLAVCICEDPDAACASDPGLGMPIGILDENEDGAADDFRMREYSGGELAAAVHCDGVNIPMDRELSFYNPSGNQLIPAGPIGINGLGPAVILVPRDGLMTGAKCSLSFQPEVVDKDGNQVCAPPNGDVEAGCSPGDTEAISFGVEPLALTGNSPSDGATGVALTASGSTDASILLQFNAAIDAASAAEAITLSDGTGEVTIETSVSADDATIVTATVPGGYAPETDYTVDISTALTDIFGGGLPEAASFSFTTDMAAPLEFVSSTPADGATDVAQTDDGSTDATIVLEFSADIDPATVAGAITLSDGAGDVTITTEVSPDDATNVIVTVTGGYALDTTYTLDVTTGLTDTAGTPLSAALSISFTTVAS